MKRVVILHCELDTDEIIGPSLAGALRKYAEALDTDNAGRLASERFSHSGVDILILAELPA